MIESDIRPDELMQGQNKAFANDIKRLLKFKNDFVLVNCPACGSNKYYTIFKKYELDYCMCELCETIYINPSPTPEILEYYYANSENYQYWNKYIFPASEKARREIIFKPRAEQVVNICIRNNKVGRLLEVGAGFGTFCNEIRKLGVFQRVIAVEPVKELADTCSEKGIEVINKRIEDVDVKDIDVVVAFEVIEHLFSPSLFLKKCYDMLSENGLLFLTCPNGLGFDISILRELSSAIDVEHLNYFNPNSITRLLNSYNFCVLELTTPGKLDVELVRKEIMSGQINVIEILDRLINKYGEKLQQFLVDNKLSSHMWLVAKKGLNESIICSH